MYYISSLDVVSRDRYEEKIKVINNNCPYIIDKALCKFTGGDSVKKLGGSNLSRYSKLFTYDEMKAYKSLKSYSYFINGFVLEVSHLKENDHNLFMGKVKPSQRMNETPGRPWVIVNPNGTVTSGHCTCMAGQGEMIRYCCSV